MHRLERLTAPLEADETLAGVYGRQVPHADATPPERFFLDFVYGPNVREQRAKAARLLAERAEARSAQPLPGRSP